MRMVELSVNVLFVHAHKDIEIYSFLEEFISQIIFKKSKKFGVGCAMAVLDNYNVKACVLFSNYDADNGSIEISAASTAQNWISRKVINQMADFVFNYLGCQAVYARCTIGNKFTERALPCAGFTRTDVPHLNGINRAQSFYVLSKKDWGKSKFNNKGKQHGKQCARSYRSK